MTVCSRCEQKLFSAILLSNSIKARFDVTYMPTTISMPCVTYGTVTCYTTPLIALHPPNML